MSTTTVYAEIVKAERNADGDLVVFGKATGPDLDLDQQVCDPAWLGKAMPEWFSTGGNIREQHSSVAAGVATELTKGDGDSWAVRSLIVDENSAKKVERKVLKGYSIGIKDPRVVKDATAPGGRIVDGTIVEVSLVDRPCNPTCTLTLAKAAVPGMRVPAQGFDPDRMLVKVEELHEQPAQDDSASSVKAAEGVEADTGKRDFSQAERDEAADSGQAMPDGSFPIKSVTDLRNAIRTVGRAKDPVAAKTHIRRRAKALGRPGLAANLKGTDADLAKDDTHDPVDIAAVRDGLVALIKAELDELCDGQDELCDVQELLCSLRMLMCWWDGEAGEGETADPYPAGERDSVITVPLAAAPDTEKATAPSPEHSAPAGVDTTELVKTAVAEAMQSHKAEIASLRDELAKVRALPVPGGPVLTRTAEDITKATRSDGLRIKAANYRRYADEVSDPVARRGYLEIADETERQATT